MAFTRTVGIAIDAAGEAPGTLRIHPLTQSPRTTRQA